MVRYLKEAFLAPVRLPLLGDFPANAAFFAIMMVFGLVHPAFALLGIGLETAFLWGLCSNARFRKWVDSKSASENRLSEESTQTEWIKLLNPLNRQEYDAILRLGHKIKETYQVNRTEDVISEANQAALDKLTHIYLKLLVAKQQLESLALQDNRASIENEIALIESELVKDRPGSSLYRSKEATLEILKKRIQSLEARHQSLAEIKSDLKRVHAQVELALDNAAMQAKPPTISMDIELSSQIIHFPITDLPRGMETTGT